MYIRWLEIVPWLTNALFLIFNSLFFSLFHCAYFFSYIFKFINFSFIMFNLILTPFSVFFNLHIFFISRNLSSFFFGNIFHVLYLLCSIFFLPLEHTDYNYHHNDLWHLKVHLLFYPLRSDCPVLLDIQCLKTSVSDIFSFLLLD